ncbi:hypothetical protein AUC69_12815 [Methyloceanibacter superfactus]|uniref:Uncharacterized protein n=1 Tax=Methyloceanibacter superfactus TaxID=1774969 RepID=A0A1E3VU09_9HYPH|nr:hypothetical protein AUC69_12815 [Methyloceanibacter superfactus]
MLITAIGLRLILGLLRLLRLISRRLFWLTGLRLMALGRGLRGALLRGRLRRGLIGGIRGVGWLGGLLLRLRGARDRRVCRHLGKSRTAVSENRALSDIWLPGPIRSLNHVRYLTLLGVCRIHTPGLATRSIQGVLPLGKI